VAYFQILFDTSSKGRLKYGNFHHKSLPSMTVLPLK